jgi:flagellar motor switch protein FliG
MIGYRRAAVALHELHEDDRQWILSELSDSDQSTLKTYLNEIRALGFASDQSLASEATASGYKNSKIAPMEQVRKADVRTLYLLLKDEPPVLIAKILKIDDWQWTNRLLENFSQSMHDRLRKLMSESATPAPALAECLVVELAQRLAKHGSMHQTSSDSKRKGTNCLVRKNWFSNLKELRALWSR